MGKRKSFFFLWFCSKANIIVTYFDLVTTFSLDLGSSIIFFLELMKVRKESDRMRRNFSLFRFHLNRSKNQLGHQPPDMGLLEPYLLHLP